MNFEKLAKRVPKKVLRWNQDDVAKWLAFIELPELEPSFRKAGVDGSILQELTIQDLQLELNITSKISRKKIMNWIAGLEKYASFLDNDKQNQANRINSEMEIEKSMPLKNESLEEKKYKKTKQLIIIPDEGTHSSLFCISEDGGKIGRHTSNNILVIQQSVSRFHAEIKYDNKKQLFTLEDLKSCAGTWIRIIRPIELKKNMVFQTGSFNFLVDSVQSQQMVLRVIQGPCNRKFLLNSKQSFKIGRKETNQIYFDDTHLSGIHAMISFLNGKFVVEDMNSTNGTWLKLAQGEIHDLQEWTVFKIGTLSSYKCQYNQQKKKIQGIRTENCVICYESDRDALYLPCKHNVVCLRCSKITRQCPVCRQKINDIIKIYK